MPESTPETPTLRGRVVFVLVMQCVVVLLCVAVTTAIAAAVQERSIREAMAERVLDVATSLAALDQVRAGVQLPRERATEELQPLADVVAQASGVDYVVITDDAGIRITHPTPSERGRPVSTDASEVLGGRTFVGTETGTIGETLRAKVPVSDGTRVVGTASVGILEARIADDFTDAIGGLLPWVVASVVVGCILSAALTTLVRRRVRRLESEARELQAQRRVAAALRDQTHEFHTRLHVIRGLVAEGDSGEALDYITGLVPVAAAQPQADDLGVSSAEVIADPRTRGIVSAAAAELAVRGGILHADRHCLVDVGCADADDLLVVSNLLRNAVEAAHSRVEILLRIDDERLHLEVGDDGDGVAPGDRARIFQRGVSSKGSQRGVGLDLVRRAVGARGGSIEIGRSPLGGAMFTVDMPRQSEHSTSRTRQVAR